MAKFAGLRDPVTMDFEGSSIAYCIDAICISLGALMGVSPVTAYIESATGISGMFCSTLVEPFERSLIGLCRGWKNRDYSHDNRLHVLRLGLLRADICVNPFMGHGWRFNDCWLADDSKVRQLYVYLNFDIDMLLKKCS